MYYSDPVEFAGIIIQIMHIREVVSKNYSPRGNFIKVWNARGWKPSVFWIFIKLPRVDNFTNDRSPNVHYLFYKMVSKLWAVVSKQILTAQSDGGGNYHSQGAVHTGPSITPGEGGGVIERAGMNSTEGVIISTTIRLQSSQYLFYIPK